jgi:hypothetical protein
LETVPRFAAGATVLSILKLVLPVLIDITGAGYSPNAYGSTRSFCRLLRRRAIAICAHIAFSEASADLFELDGAESAHRVAFIATHVKFPFPKRDDNTNSEYLGSVSGKGAHD